MSLNGQAAILIWNDVGKDAEADFREWHNREHAPERIGIPGFLRARRFRAVSGERLRFFILYELDSTNALSSCDYMARLADPTPWTKRMSGVFSNSSRSLSKVEFSRGIAQGGVVYTMAYDVYEGYSAEHYALLAHNLLPALSDQPGIVGAHLCCTDMDRSVTKTAEKKGRLISTAGWTVIVEGAGDPSLLQEVCDGFLHEKMSAAGARGPLTSETFRLEYSLGKHPWG